MNQHSARVGDGSNKVGRLRDVSTPSKRRAFREEGGGGWGVELACGLAFLVSHFFVLTTMSYMHVTMKISDVTRFAVGTVEVFHVAFGLKWFCNLARIC